MTPYVNPKPYNRIYTLPVVSIDNDIIILYCWQYTINVRDMYDHYISAS